MDAAKARPAEVEGNADAALVEGRVPEALLAICIVFH
jgi:hypothetical protein